uniref:DNA-directed RNA polymerase II subunit RPB9-like zinc ribbon domain-containing protein n=1 Tax=Cairina moschata TaxID=8855 RepID=A0A8C3D1L6_CAIMO
MVSPSALQTRTVMACPYSSATCEPISSGVTCGGRSQSSGSCTSRASAAWKSSSTSACASSSSASAIAEAEGAARGAGPAMLLFCPACGNVLVAEEGPRCHRFACTTCPYVRNVTRKVTSRKYPQLKEVDDVLGGAAAWENVDSTAGQCPKQASGASQPQSASGRTPTSDNQEHGETGRRKMEVKKCPSARLEQWCQPGSPGKQNPAGSCSRLLLVG